MDARHPRPLSHATSSGKRFDEAAQADEEGPSPIQIDSRTQALRCWERGLSVQGGVCSDRLGSRRLSLSASTVASRSDWKGKGGMVNRGSRVLRNKPGHVCRPQGNRSLHHGEARALSASQQDRLPLSSTQSNEEATRPPRRSCCQSLTARCGYWIVSSPGRGVNQFPWGWVGHGAP